jgi:hypothetical protein
MKNVLSCIKFVSQVLFLITIVGLVGLLFFQEGRAEIAYSLTHWTLCVTDINVLNLGLLLAQIVAFWFVVKLLKDYKREDK